MKLRTKDRWKNYKKINERKDKRNLTETTRQDTSRAIRNERGNVAKVYIEQRVNKTRRDERK